jgi:glycosyltransferase involved in cell wall biosynthesis
MICSANGPLVEEMKKISVPVKIFNNLKREISPFNDIIALYQIRKFIKKNKYEVVHTHSSKSGFLGRIAAKTAGVPLVIHTVHGFSFGQADTKLKSAMYYVLELIASRFSDYTIVMNESDRLFCKKKLRISESRIIFLANGIQDSKFFSEKVINSERIENALITNNNDTKIFKLVFVGRLWSQKNPLLLISALEILKEKVGSIFKATLIGDGELMLKARRYAAELKLDQEIEFLGWVENAIDLIPNYDALVLPSNYEGMPLSIIEAMACKVPVVASKISGNIDLIRHLENGLLFESGSAIDFAQKLQMLIKDPTLGKILSDRAYREAKSKYTSSVHCSYLKKIYEK